MNPDPARRRLMANTVAAAAVVPLPAFSNGGLGGFADPDAELVRAEAEYFAARAAEEEAEKKAADAWKAKLAFVGACPTELMPTDDDRDAADVIARFQGRRWGCFDLAFQPAEPHSVHVWAAAHLRTAIAAAPAALGRAGTTPHLLRRWRALVPIVEAYEARVAAGDALFQADALEDACQTARERVGVAEQRIVDLPAHTASGIAVKARVWTAKRAGQFGTMWDIKLPAPLQAVVDAALAVGAQG